MTQPKKKSSRKSAGKTYSAKRTMNETLTSAVRANATDTKTFQQHDAKNRLGAFAGTGNHARTGNRGHQ